MMEYTFENLNQTWRSDDILDVTTDNMACRHIVSLSFYFSNCIDININAGPEVINENHFLDLVS